MKPYVGPSDDKQYDSVIEAYARSDWGEKQWKLHKHADIPLFDADTQWELTPLQTKFLFHAADEHGPDEPDDPTDGDQFNASAHQQSATHTQTESIL